MVFVFPLAIWFGALAVISFLITLCLGVARKSIKVHKFFAGITLLLVILHGIFAYLLYFKGIVV